MRRMVLVPGLCSTCQRKPTLFSNHSGRCTRCVTGLVKPCMYRCRHTGAGLHRRGRLCASPVIGEAKLLSRACPGTAGFHTTHHLDGVVINGHDGCVGLLRVGHRSEHLQTLRRGPNHAGTLPQILQSCQTDRTSPQQAISFVKFYHEMKKNTQKS